MGDDIRALVVLSAALAVGDRSGLREAVDRAASDADPVEAEEALLQSYLFLGYPAALNAMAVWRERTGRAAPESAETDWELWQRRGARVCSTVYGGQYERLRRNIARLHPDMERWMVAEGYGKVLGRPGLALDRRELCIVALLAGIDAPRQLYSHLRGSLNAGARPEDVERVLEWIGPVVGAERIDRARDVWQKVADRREGREDS